MERRKSEIRARRENRIREEIHQAEQTKSFVAYEKQRLMGLRKNEKM
jgi:hypothetical protein